MSANEILEMLISERIKISQALQYTRLLLLNSSSVVHLDWVTSECNGYDSKLEIPDYRKNTMLYLRSNCSSILWYYYSTSSA